MSTPPTLKSLAALATKASPDDVWPYGTANDDGDLVFTKEAMALIKRCTPEAIESAMDALEKASVVLDIEQLHADQHKWMTSQAKAAVARARNLLDGQSHAEGESHV